MIRLMYYVLRILDRWKFRGFGEETGRVLCVFRIIVLLLLAVGDRVLDFLIRSMYLMRMFGYGLFVLRFVVSSSVLRFICELYLMTSCLFLCKNLHVVYLKLVLKVKHSWLNPYVCDLQLGTFSVCVY